MHTCCLEPQVSNQGESRAPCTQEDRGRIRATVDPCRPPAIAAFLDRPAYYFGNYNRLKVPPLPMLWASPWILITSDRRVIYGNERRARVLSCRDSLEDPLSSIKGYQYVPFWVILLRKIS